MSVREQLANEFATDVDLVRVANDQSKFRCGIFTLLRVKHKEQDIEIKDIYVWAHVLLFHFIFTTRLK